MFVMSTVTYSPETLTGTFVAKAANVLGRVANVTALSDQAVLTSEKSSPPATSTLFTKTVSVAFPMFAAVVPAGRLLRSNWNSPVLPGALDAPNGPTAMVPRFPKFRASLVGLTYVSPKGPLELPHAAGASRAQTVNTVEWSLVHRFVFVFMHNPPVKTARERFTRPVLEWDTWGQTDPASTFGLLLDHQLGWQAKAPAPRGTAPARSPATAPATVLEHPRTAHCSPARP